MDSRRRTEGSYPELFPKDYPERLERLVELIGLTWEEFAERLGVENERVTAWRKGRGPEAPARSRVTVGVGAQSRTGMSSGAGRRRS